MLQNKAPTVKSSNYQHCGIYNFVHVNIASILLVVSCCNVQSLQAARNLRMTWKGRIARQQNTDERPRATNEWYSSGSFRAAWVSFRATMILQSVAEPFLVSYLETLKTSDQWYHLAHYWRMRLVNQSIFYYIIEDFNQLQSYSLWYQTDTNWRSNWAKPTNQLHIQKNPHSRFT